MSTNVVVVVVVVNHTDSFIRLKHLFRRPAADCRWIISFLVSFVLAKRIFIHFHAIFMRS